MRKVFELIQSELGTFITIVCIGTMFFIAVVAVVSALWFMR